MPNIQSMKVRAVRVPIDPPHKTASGVVSESPLVLTDVFCDDGVVGHSLVFTYTTAVLKPTADLIRNLEDLIRGEPLAPFEMEQKLSKRFRLLGTQGLVGIALAAVDMALWDALARTHDTSLVGLLGGASKPIPAYAPVGYDGPEMCAKTAAEWVERGFKGVKAKIGYPTVQQDLDVIRAMRSAVGNSTAIMVDYNQCLTTAEAIERMSILDGEGLAWVEEPTRAHDFAGSALIAREARTPIQSGENWCGVLDLRHALEAGAADLIMPDVMKIGGVTGWLRAAALAQAHGIRMSSHIFPQISAQLLGLTPTAHWLEYLDWWNPILENPLQIRDGMAIVDSAPGSGLAWNEQAVERYSA